MKQLLSILLLCFAFDSCSSDMSQELAKQYQELVDDEISQKLSYVEWLEQEKQDTSRKQYCYAAMSGATMLRGTYCICHGDIQQAMMFSCVSLGLCAQAYHNAVRFEEVSSEINKL